MKKIINLLNEYEGIIQNNNEQIKISNLNTLYKTYNKYNEETGTITFIENKPTKVNCEIEIIKTNKGYHISGSEDTCEILGGISTTYGNLETTIKAIDQILEKYNFKHKKYTQLSLF